MYDSEKQQVELLLVMEKKSITYQLNNVMVTGKLNTIKLKSEEELVRKYSLGEYTFVNFSFSEAIKTKPYLNQKGIGIEQVYQKYNLKSLIGMEIHEIYESEKMIELFGVAIDIMSNSNKAVLIGLAGCSNESIDRLKKILKNT